MNDLSNILLADPEQLKEESYLDKNVENSDIRTAMLFIQDYIVDRVTGTCLLNKLKYLICTDQINCDRYRWYAKLLNEYIFPLLAYGVQSELAPNLTLKERNQGIIRNNDPNLQYPGLDDVRYIKSQHDTKKDFYVNRAVKFLKCNRERFKDLCGCDCLCCTCDCNTAPFSDVPYSTPFSLNITVNNSRNKYRI